MKKLIFILLFIPVIAFGSVPHRDFIREALIGINETHMFVLREVHADMGKDDLKVVDIVLIARERGTNVDDEVWPVSRTFDLDTYMNWLDETPPHRAEVPKVDGLVNPDDILMERKARLELWKGVLAHELRFGQVSVGDGAITAASGRRQYRLSFKEAANAIETSVRTTGDVMAMYFEGVGSSYFAGADGFYLRAMAIDPQDRCSFERFFAFLDYENREQHASFMVFASCQGSNGDIVQADIILDIPREE